jgi:hypothetical protein
MIANRALLRGQRLAFAEVVQAAVDPQSGQLFPGAVLRQPAMQCGEVCLVHLLILIEAGENGRPGNGCRSAAHPEAQTSFVIRDIDKFIEAARRSGPDFFSSVSELTLQATSVAR